MELTIDKLWSTLFIDTPVSQLKKLGKEKFLRNYIEEFEKNNNQLLDVNTRIDMAAIIDVVETRDDPLGGMNFAQTVEATNADMLRAVTEWIQNYQNQGYTNIDDKIINVMAAAYLGRLEKGTYSDEQIMTMTLHIDKTITGGR